MTSNKFDLLVGKALLEEKYRDKLRNSATREDALKDIGITHPTQDELNAVQEAFDALEDLKGVFSGTGAA
jgi:hypothetical protein